MSNTREQRAWSFYDWANSAFATTVAGVLFAPYLITVAQRAADAAGTDRLSLLGLQIAPGSLPAYVITLSTLLSAVLLPLLGAYADRVARRPLLLGVLGWSGALFTGLLFFLTGERWLFGSVTFLIANLCFAASTVVYDSILNQIAEEDERDRVSSVAWAYGYAGGGLLLAANFGLVTFADQLGLGTELAVRISLLSAAVWWAVFTLIPVLGVRSRLPTAVVAARGGLLQRSFGQLWHTVKDLRNYPVALTFLLAYLFFNDGIQTVIASASTFGTKELGFDEGTVLGVYLVVQFVAVLGALAFGRVAMRVGAKRTIIGGLVGWCGLVTAAWWVPEGSLLPFLALGVGIGIVLGGTQALARSYFSLLIPRGKEAEYFSFYHAIDRGTSWFGTLVFGLVFQFTDSYRPAIFALIVFFILGGFLFCLVDTRKGIAQAGNDQPAVV